MHQLARWILDGPGSSPGQFFFFQERDFTLPIPLSGNE